MSGMEQRAGQALANQGAVFAFIVCEVQHVVLTLLQL